LLAFEPNNFENQVGSASLTGRLSWVEIPRDDQKFFRFLDDVVSLLEQPEPPKASPDCEWCRYRGESRRLGV
jgi:CRISPR/Cas system-associated exonuclease Cas4 (RecB family)